MKKQIAVVYGGYSGEEVISRKSAAMIMNNIDRDRFDTTLVCITRNGWDAETDGSTYTIDKNDFSAVLPTGKVNFACAFIIIHGTPGEDGLLQGYFDMIGLPYTTGDVLNMSLTFDKFTANSFLREKGFNTAKAVLVSEGRRLDTSAIVGQIGFPCFVKPNRGGSSFATFKCKTEAEVGAAITKAFEVSRQVIIEEFISGREYTCGLVIKDGKTTALPVTEIISEGEFFDFAAKYEGKSSELTPADIPISLFQKIQSTSREVFELLSCRGMARVDYLHQGDDLYIIEVNGVPGFSEVSIVPQQAAAAGISTKELISIVIDSVIG